MMRKDTAAIEISTMPEVSRLAEEVQRTGSPRVLKHNGKDVALLLPIPARSRTGTRRPLSRRYPNIASLAGAAGTLPQPMTWKEMQSIIREERAEKYRAKGA